MNEFFLRSSRLQSGEYFYRLYARELVDESIISSKNNGQKNTTLVPLIPKIQKKTYLKRIASLKGWRLTLIESYLKEILKKRAKNAEKEQVTLTGERIKMHSQEKVHVLSEEDGVRLALLFKTSSRLMKMPKVDRALLVIKAMLREEVYYWYSKVFSNEKKKNGLRAFRILICE